MRKYLWSAVFIFTAILWLEATGFAAIPTARITYPTDGMSVCSYSTSTTSVSVNVFAGIQTDTPTSIEYSYRHKGDTAWTVIASTGVPAAAVLWDVSGLTNGGIYEVRAIASNNDGTDPSPGFIWLKVNQNPQVNFAVGGSITNVFNGKLYVKAGTLEVYSIYTNVFVGQFRKMNTLVTPSISLTPKDKSAISGNVNTWSTTSVSSDTVKQNFNIDSTTGEGEAVLSISGAKDVNGFTQDAFSTTLIIDTQNPSVSSLQVDEDGDGSFADNTGYVKNGQTPRFYVTFNESIFDISYASYTPTGKTSIALVGPTWVDVDHTMCYFTTPAAIDATTGDGLANVVIGTFRDAALNSQTYTATNLFTIDGTPPRVPIITAPAQNSTKNEGSIMEVTLETPTETDIKYARFTTDGGVTYIYDYTAPYQAAIQVTAAMTNVTVAYVDNAGNTSANAVVNFTVNPLVDKTVPMAKIPTFTINTWPTLITLTAKVNDAETNIRQIEFQYSSDNSTWHTISTDSKNDDGFKANWCVTDLATGKYYLRAIATDKNGNTDPSPSVMEVWLSQEAWSLETTATYAKADPIYSIQGSMDATTHTITAHINSSSQPNVAIGLYNVYNNETNWILPEAITVTGSGTSWDATVTDAAITINNYATIYMFAQNTNGETLYRDCNVGVISIDKSNDTILLSTNFYGLYCEINAGSVQNSTNLLIKTVQTPVTTQSNILAVGPTYDLSLEDGETNFTPVTLHIHYPDVTNTGNMYPNTNARTGKLTICYWDEGNQKWVRDENLVHYAAGNTWDRTDTNHFSKFSVIADYQPPVINDVQVTGEVLTAKVTDEGSGIYATGTAGSYLRVNGVTYYRDSYDADTDKIVFDAAFNDAGDYPYVMRIIDQVDNYTEYSGVMSYTKKAEINEAHNYPNPFDPDKEDTTIRFVLTENSTVTARIYDFNGDLVSVLQKNALEGTGLIEYKWGGTNDRGDKVANGTYFAEILASGSANSITGRTLRKIIKIAVVRRKGG